MARLADYLATLSGISMTKEETDEILNRYYRLHQYDKKRTQFSPRHKKKLTQGRFKPRRASTITPGVESTQR